MRQLSSLLALGACGPDSSSGPGRQRAARARAIAQLLQTHSICRPCRRPILMGPSGDQNSSASSYFSYAMVLSLLNPPHRVLLQLVFSAPGIRHPQIILSGVCCLAVGLPISLFHTILLTRFAFVQPGAQTFCPLVPSDPSSCHPSRLLSHSVPLVFKLTPADPHPHSGVQDLSCPT